MRTMFLYRGIREQVFQVGGSAITSSDNSTMYQNVHRDRGTKGPIQQT